MKYRPEIDGLRAIAVLSVVLFHAEIPGFGGGFVGVDVFFVISGFLITTILRTDIAQGRFSIRKFYDHRIRRIIPALVVVLAVTTVFARQWMLPWQFEEYANSAIAALTFWSNFFFWQTSGYFDVGVDEKVLLHTWSLSVEEQYYLLFPIVFFVLWRFGQRLTLAMLLLVALLSLGLAEWGWRNSPQASFFVTPTRVWEILLGAAAALVAKRTISRTLGETLAFFGLIAIGVSVALFEHYPSPSVYLLPALLGTVAILLFSHAGGPTARILSFQPLVGVGLVSYSLYLWHQPLFALFRIRFGPIDTIFDTTVLIALATGLAILSYWIVEKPFRVRKDGQFLISTRVAIPTCAVVVSGLLISCGFFINEANNGRFKGAEIIYTDAMVDTRIERARTWELYVTNPDFQNDSAQFPMNIDTERRILIVGDSHAKDMFNALELNADLFPNTAFRYAFFSDGCMAPQAKLTAEYTAQCLSDFADDHDALVASATHVLTSMNWIKYDTEEIEPLLRTASTFFQSRGKAVVLTSNSPIYRPSSPYLISQLYREGTLDKATADRVHFANIDPRVVEANRIIANVATDTGATYLAKSEFVCEEAKSICYAMTPDGHAVYPDNGHYTVEGAQFFGQIIAQIGWLDQIQ